MRALLCSYIRLPLTLHRLGLIDAEQLGAVNIAHPGAGLGGRRSGDPLRERVIASGRIDDDKIPSIAPRPERGGEALAAVGLLPTLADRAAYGLEVGAETPRLLEFIASGRACLVVRRPLVPHKLKAKLFLKLPREFLQLVLVEARIDREQPSVFAPGDPAPRDMHVYRAVREMVKRDRPWLAAETEPLFLTVGNVQPRLPIKRLARCEPCIAMKKRLLAVRSLRHDFNILECRAQIARRETAHLDKLPAFPRMAFHQIRREL